jgi:hypothetical protein
MTYDIEVFSHQFPIVFSFAQHLAYYRGTKATYDNLKIASPFWCAMLDAHLMVAALQWCKVFGAHGCNSTHWKKIPAPAATDAQRLFKANVLSRVGFTESEWKKYHDEMCTFRNAFVAHHELGISRPVPDFGIALEVALAYDNWIRTLILPDVYEGPPIEDDYKDWVKQAELLSMKALSATTGMSG